MASLRDIASIAGNSDLTARTRAAAMVVAQEKTDDPFAHEIMRNPQIADRMFAASVATDPAISTAETSEPGSCTDDAILTRVRAAWDTVRPYGR